MIHPEDTQTRFEPVHVDKRKLPHLLLRTPARVVGPSGEKLAVTLRDVSPDGLQLRCSREAAGKLHPSGGVIRDGDTATHLQVTFAAPCEAGRAVITVLGRIIYVAIVAPDVVAIGVSIVGASKADRARMDSVFSYAMRPCDVYTPPRRPAPRQIKGAGDRMLVKPRTGSTHTD